MELEVAVEKNQRVKPFSGFSPSMSRQGEGDISGHGDGPGSSKVTERETSPAKALPHKLPPMFKVAVIGDTTAGKTVICEAFCNKNFTPVSKYFMTCGVQIYGKCLTSSVLYVNAEGKEEKRGEPGKEEKVNLILLDSAGKDLYREYLPKYWEKLDSVALVIDLTSDTALESGLIWINFVGPSLSSKFAGQAKKSGVVIGTKTDLKDQRVITYEDAASFAAQHNLEYFECSVRNNVGFGEPFYFLAKEWFEFQLARRGPRGTSSRFRGQDK